MKNNKLNLFWSFAVIAILFLVSCGEANLNSNNESTTQSVVIDKNVEANAKLAVSIEGMVCSKGCVKAIESEFSKVAGVKSCDVDYSTGMATIEFNNSTVSEDELIAVFPKIGSGQYKAVKKEEG